MRSHAISFALVLILFSNSNSKGHCFSRSRDDNNSNHEPRENPSDDIFTNQDGNKDLPPPLISDENQNDVSVLPGGGD